MSLLGIVSFVVLWTGFSCVAAPFIGAFLAARACPAGDEGDDSTPRDSGFHAVRRERQIPQPYLGCMVYRIRDGR